MKRGAFGIFIITGLLFLAACSDCSIVEDSGNPKREFRLFNNEGDDLWFGSTAIYDPAQVVFEHETAGVLPTSINPSANTVMVVIPSTLEDEEQIIVRLDSASVDNIRYSAFQYDSKCKMVYELSYLFFNEQKICTLCGTTEFTEHPYIDLVK